MLDCGCYGEKQRAKKVSDALDRAPTPSSSNYKHVRCKHGMFGSVRTEKQPKTARPLPPNQKIKEALNKFSSKHHTGLGKTPVLPLTKKNKGVPRVQSRLVTAVRATNSLSPTDINFPRNTNNTTATSTTAPMPSSKHAQNYIHIKFEVERGANSTVPFFGASSLRARRPYGARGGCLTP